MSEATARLSHRTRAVFLVNPHNPTGTLVIVDEACLKFADDFPCRTLAGLVGAADNVIVFRTCAKIYGLAGLDIGCVAMVAAKGAAPVAGGAARFTRQCHAVARQLRVLRNKDGAHGIRGRAADRRHQDRAPSLPMIAGQGSPLGCPKTIYERVVRLRNYYPNDPGSRRTAKFFVWAPRPSARHDINA
jgi:hypothetical protein